MAQNTNTTSIGCASGIVRGLGILLLLAGLGNAFSGEGAPSFVVAIIGLVLLLAGSGKKQRRKENHEALQQQAAPPKKTDQPCPNPEPHRHYELPRQPLYNGARLIENRKTLYQAGLLTREEYDAEVRKLRSR